MACAHDFKYIRKVRPELDVSPNGIVVWECVLCDLIVPRYPEKLSYEECCWCCAYNKQKQIEEIIKKII